MELFHNLIFDTHLLQNRQTEPLSDTAICTIDIPCDDLKNLLQDCEVYLLWWRPHRLSRGLVHDLLVLWVQ